MTIAHELRGVEKRAGQIHHTDMFQVLKSVSSVFSAAVMTGLLWYFANSFARKNGVGLLERQPWPLNNIWLCATAVAALAAISMLIAYQFSSRRREAMESAAGMLGLSYRGGVSRNSLNLQGPLCLFDDWDEGTNLISGEFDGIPVQIFDFVKTRTSRVQSSSSSGDNTVRENQTVFLLELPEDYGVPVQILRGKALLWMMQAFGLSGIEFQLEGSLAAEEDRTVLQKFNRDYLVLHGAVDGGHRDGQAARTLSSAAEEHLRRLETLMGLPLVKRLAEGRGWSIEVGRSHVAIWMQKTRLKPQQIPECLAEVTALHRLLLEGDAHSGMRLSASGQATVSLQNSGSQIAVLAVSGCLGMVLAFGMFVPVFFMFADRAPWIVFVWPFFGLAVIALSVFIGTRLASKWRGSA